MLLRLWSLLWLLLPTCGGFTIKSRLLFGSNCVDIQRGVVPKYYTCVGCISEEAQACIDDMRRNTSFNLYTACNMDNILYEITAIDACCPTFNDKGVLQYMGSNYPSAFQCLEDVGCRDSTWYRQLQLECEYICPLTSNYTIPGSTSSSCYATFSGSRRNYYLNVYTLLMSIICITLSFYCI